MYAKSFFNRAQCIHCTGSIIQFACMSMNRFFLLVSYPQRRLILNIQTNLNLILDFKEITIFSSKIRLWLVFQSGLKINISDNFFFFFQAKKNIIQYIIILCKYSACLKYMTYLDYFLEQQQSKEGLCQFLYKMVRDLCHFLIWGLPLWYLFRHLNEDLLCLRNLSHFWALFHFGGLFFFEIF